MTKVPDIFSELLSKHGVSLRGDSSSIESFTEEINELCSKFQRAKEDFDKFRIALDAIPVTISWVKSDLTYIEVNDYLASVCSLDKNDFVNQPIGFSSKNKFFKSFARDLFENSTNTRQLEIVEEVQEKKNAYWVIGTKYHSNEEAVIIGIDITEVKNLEQRLQFSEKLTALGEMLAGIIHDLNNPLAVISGYSRMISKKSTDPLALKNSAKIQQATDRLVKIVKGVKVFVRDGSKVDFENVRFKDILEESILILSHKLTSNGIDFQLGEIQEDVILNCNYTQIFQVLVNLLSNSIDAIMEDESKKERWIKINQNLTSKKLIVTITDSGNGIPEDIAEEIFKSFYTTKDVGQGSGLGLSLCRRIMHEHNGSIELDKSSANTSFILTFSLEA